MRSPDYYALVRTSPAFLIINFPETRLPEMKHSVIFTSTRCRHQGWGVAQFEINDQLIMKEFMKQRRFFLTAVLLILLLLAFRSEAFAQNARPEF